MSHFHLAQINIAKAKQELDSPVMSGFVARLDEINALAERTPGFVWRLKTEEGDATALRVFNDPLLIINMSVWQDIETLKAFVYQTAHIEVLRSRASWFDKMDESHLALWWVEAGHEPSLEEAKQKLVLIQRLGPTADAFNFSRTFGSIK